MDKFVAVIVLVGLVIMVYLGVFQGGLSQSVADKGTQVQNVISSKNN